MSEELKPCPFCGSTDLDSGGDDKIVGYWCRNCQAQGPNHYGSYVWNQRAKPVVKALEFFKWKRAGGGYHEGQFSANTQAGNYAIMHHESKGLYYLVCPDSTGYYDTLDEAKAAAQADFTRRVRACLEGYDD